MKAIAPFTTQAIISVSASLVASVLASWMLRRLLFRLESPQSVNQQTPPATVTVVVPVILIGNTIASQVFVPRWRRPLRTAFRILFRMR